MRRAIRESLMKMIHCVSARRTELNQAGPPIKTKGRVMTLLPAVAVAATMVYWLSGFIGQHFSELATSIIDLLLFVVFMVTINTFLKNLRGD
jgi:ribosomal protein S19